MYEVRDGFRKISRDRCEQYNAEWGNPHTLRGSNFFEIERPFGVFEGYPDLIDFVLLEPDSIGFTPFRGDGTFFTPDNIAEYGRRNLVKELERHTRSKPNRYHTVEVADESDGTQTTYVVRLHMDRLVVTSLETLFDEGNQLFGMLTPSYNPKSERLRRKYTVFQFTNRLSERPDRIPLDKWLERFEENDDVF